jgi:hypothetical protein
VGLNTQYFAGAITVVLAGLTLFFTSGGLALVRGFEDKVLMISWLFPNIYAVDPLRDMILFHEWPVDWNTTLLTLAAFAVGALAVGWGLAARQLRRLG